MSNGNKSKTEAIFTWCLWIGNERRLPAGERVAIEESADNRARYFVDGKYGRWIKVADGGKSLQERAA